LSELQNAKAKVQINPLQIDIQYRNQVTYIKQVIERLRLNLSGRVILTEIGSAFYMYTPIIALLAGAQRVYAWTSDSQYGAGKEISEKCMSLCTMVEMENKIEISVNEKPETHIQKADIITNSGFLRPINKRFINNIKYGAVIALMYESWELRGQDIDIEFCREKGIRVAGTWENDPLIKVFDCIGSLAVKLAMEAGYEITNNNILVWSNDDFGEVISRSFKALGANQVVQTTDTARLYGILQQIDFIFICDYDEIRNYTTGANAVWDLKKMASINQSFGIVHLYGEINSFDLDKFNISLYPKKNGKAMFMSQTLGYIGFRPIINLNAAGFKVAECMIKGESHSLVQPITY